MNVIVSNRQKEIIDNANIDAIKDLNGLFNVDDLINKFKNYFFSKMILDATSVVNFASKEVLTTLVNEIGAEKLIILLPSNPEPPMEFKKLLIDLKIYNFTNNIDDVVKFIENPNTYEDAIKTLDASFGNNMYVDNSIKDGDNPGNDINNMQNDNMNTGNLGDNNNINNNINDNMNNNITDNNINNNINNNSDFEMPHQSLGEMLSSFNVADFDKDIETSDNEEPKEESNNVEPQEEQPSSGENTIDYGFQMNYNNVDNNEENNNNFENNNTGKNTFLIFDNIDNNDFDTGVKKGKMVIGVKNVTSHAGSTSLIYMLHRMVADTLKKNVLSIEIDKKDFKLYRDNKMISVDNSNVNQIIEDSKDDVIFIDLNDYEDLSVCTDVLYLVEPSTIKLNKLMVENKSAFNELKGKKVIINKSLLSDIDVRTLASEAGIDFFYKIEPLNDRIFNDAIDNLVKLLGI